MQSHLLRHLGGLACLTAVSAAFAQPVPPVPYWHEVAVATVLAQGGNSTDAERQPAFSTDMATVHVAIHDAVSAIDGRYQLYGARPLSAAKGASMEAAAAAAAHGVLASLFPQRAQHYQAAYDRYVASIADSPAKTAGIKLGMEAAANMLATRKGDGRDTVLPAYVPGSTPGAYRGENPILRLNVHLKPFALRSAAQFRPGPPPALTSPTYAAHWREVMELGGASSTRRTPDQLDMARFYAEAPTTFITRNYGKFATRETNTADAARLMALIYMVNADAMCACFDAKYYYNTWRPLSAIPLADTDGNDATEPVKDWKPSLPTPVHPEYPAGHSCVAGSMDALLRAYYGKQPVSFTFDNPATGTSRHYDSPARFIEESMQARIYGGMHFRFSTEAGAKLGADVANWVVAQRLQPR